VNLAERFQTLVGFGASVAWYGDWLTAHPNRARIYDLVFRELGLDILRLRNVYRGDSMAFDPTAAALVAAATASLEHPPRLLLSSWSPPAALKANESTDCAGETTCTLARSDGAFVYAAFADYWLDSLRAYAAIGVSPDWISIQNEPDFVPPSWEGCRFDPTEGQYPSYATALAAVRARLRDTPHQGVGLLGPEVISLQGGRLRSYVESLPPGALDVLAHHLYDGNGWMLPDNYITPMRDAARLLPDKPTFQTEFSVTNGEGAFETAWLIHNSLVEQGVAAYFYWALIWNADDGLVSLDDPATRDAWRDDSGYAVRDAYYSVQHFARFTDPGDVRVGATSGTTTLKVSAFISAGGDRLTLTVLNTGKQTYRVKLTDPGLSRGTAQVYRTSETDHFAALGELVPGGTFDMPPRSIVTLVVSD
jgi:glucuronoarabinoxylan endo-1,4-beta-xylanase